MKDIWHLCSQELPNKIIFKTLDDYKFGMNSIPIALQETGICIYCFILMNNHVHLLISGTVDAATEFFTKFKRRLAAHLSKKHRIQSPLKGLNFKLIEVTDEQMFRNEVAYILRNCVAAKMNDPYNYPWSTGGIYFKHCINKFTFRRIGDMNGWEIRNVLSTRVHLPDGYLISNGIIRPESYVQVATVEHLFGSALNLFWYLKDWKSEQKAAQLEWASEKKSIEQDRGPVDKAMYEDTVLLEKLQPKFKEYSVSGFNDMDDTMKRIFVPILRNAYGSNVKQVCRLIGLDEATVRRFGGWM